MPIINGMKMACEPCIRGHRSTKCTHANERLMVPVKKPGRPLTACPHLQPHICGCSSITAAIPRKSQCGCGTPPNKTVKTEPQPAASALHDLPSPTAANFKVKKASQVKSRKQSYDTNVFDKIDPNSVNVVPFASQRPPQLIAPALPNGYKPPAQQVPYFDGNQNVAYQTQSPPLNYGTNSPYLSSNGNGRYPIPNGNGVNGLYIPLESLPESVISSGPNSASPSCCSPPNGIKLDYDSQEPERPQRSCCSNTPEAAIDGMVFANENRSQISSSGNGTSAMPQFVYPPTYPAIPPLYNAYAQQATVFAYPPSYGSYQNPLQPSEWRQSVMNNMYAQPAQPLASLNDISTLFPMQTPDLDLNTLHSCGCGDTCQCIGCAAHPYNDATQEYVRSAYKGLHESPTPTANVYPGNAYNISATPLFDTTDGGYGGSSNGKDFAHPAAAKFAVQPTTGHDVAGARNGNSENHSPLSEEGASTGVEETLSASDFFFVNYPISAEGCGGDTTSCPCGEDCQCLGCTIHRLDEPVATVGDMGNARNVKIEIAGEVEPGGSEAAEEVGVGTGAGPGAGAGVVKSCCR